MEEIFYKFRGFEPERDCIDAKAQALTNYTGTWMYRGARRRGWNEQTGGLRMEPRIPLSPIKKHFVFFNSGVLLRKTPHSQIAGFEPEPSPTNGRKNSLWKISLT